MNKLNPAGALVGRVLLAAIFILAGFSKIGGYAGAQGYMESMGVPGALLPLVIATELGGGLLLVLGLWTRVAAFALAGFTLLSALLFHANLGDATQQIMFLKNLAIAGGLLVLLTGAMPPLSLDARRARA